MTALIRDAEAFHRLAASGAELLVVYFADWCPHCVRFLRECGPTLDALAGPAVIRRDVSDEDTDACWEDECSVKVVPTIALWRGGRIVARLDGVLGQGIEPARLARWFAGLDAP